MPISPVLSLIVLLVASPAPAGSDWLPAQAQEAAARELARGMEGLEIGGNADAAQRLEAGRRAIGQIVERLEGWGVQGVLDRTPSIPGLDFPPTDEPILAAIASWGGCALPLYEELAESAGERWYVVLNKTSIAIVSGYLRHGFLAEGGTDAELKAYLAGDAMNALSPRVARDPALRADINAQCGPNLTALYGK